MSIDSLNSLNNNSNLRPLSGSSATDKLTNNTKTQLASLGIDTSTIKTESEGQLKLKEIITQQQAQQNQQTQQSHNHHHHQNGSTQIETIKKQAQGLAAQIGANISTSDNVNAILAKINTKLAVMTVQASNNVQKTQQLQQYETQFAYISQEYSNYEEQKQQSNFSSEGQLTGSLSSMAMYNKLYFNLS